MKVQPYLQFDGRCEEAMNFYKGAVGAEVVAMMKFKQHPEPRPPQMKPEFDDKVMHAELRIGDSTVMCSDGRCNGQQKFDGFSLTAIVQNDAQAERAFAALSEGGQVCMPLTRTFFSSRFGMVNDRFGVSWMVLVRQQEGANQ